MTSNSYVYLYIHVYLESSWKKLIKLCSKWNDKNTYAAKSNSIIFPLKNNSKRNVNLENAEIWILYNFHVLWKNILLLIFSRLKMWKSFLIHRPYNTRGQAGLGPRAIVCSQVPLEFVWEQKYFFCPLIIKNV